MLIMSCRPHEGYVLPVENDAVVCRQIILALCRQIEIGVSVKCGAKLSQVRNDEIVIAHNLHNDFASLSGVQLKPSARPKCDICQLIDTVTRMSKSEYSRECVEFLAKYPDDSIRADFDLALELRKYAGAARLTSGTWHGKQLIRVGGILRIVQQMRVAPRNHEDRRLIGSSAPNEPIGIDNIWGIMPALDKLMKDSIQRMTVLRGVHLRLIWP